MSTIKERLSSVFFFSSTEDALSAEKARNEEARLDIVKARVEHSDFEQATKKQIHALDSEVKKKRDGFAEKAKPLLKEFDEVGQSQHFYQQVASTIAGQEQLSDQLSKKELMEYGYMSKKLISVALNYERLREQIQAGRPFEKELAATLEDAESDNLNLIAEPLQAYKSAGIPSTTAVKASAFNLARAMEDSGKTPVQPPVNGWLDFLKFRVSFSPSAAERQLLESRKAAASFTQRVEMEDYIGALELVDSFIKKTNPFSKPSGDFFESSFRQFKASTTPVVASRMLLDYTNASLSASRLACVEDTLKNA
ncbi:hypothetical protein, conserved [Angomonas deanei]|uniref:Uncharacterized protein n=1 Tax=Angomonas deanei TaxID=59799 RepID=A0A7G2C6V2_9TRYP|nr:hypothetical protein, conserved [Angomonas deanei]